MLKVMVTGANGLVGQAFVKSLLKSRIKVIATGRGESRLGIEHENINWYSADITHPFQLQEIIIKELPDIIVHSAAMTQVDDCELQQNEAHNINVEATARLLLDAEAYCKHFIFLSTDFVFDGEKGMYEEEDNTNPVNWYGHTKLEAEAIVQTAEIPWAIVRTCLVYGNKPVNGRHNIYSWIKENLEEHKSIKVVDDQLRTPTLVDDLAEGITSLIKQGRTGIWHISGEEKLTPFQMALRTAKYYGLDESLVIRVTAAEFTQPGRRPPLTGFNISKAKKDLGYSPKSFDAALDYLSK